MAEIIVLIPDGGKSDHGKTREVLVPKPMPGLPRSGVQATIGVEPASLQRVTLRNLAPLPSSGAIIGLLTATDGLLPWLYPPSRLVL